MPKRAGQKHLSRPFLLSEMSPVRESRAAHAVCAVPLDSARGHPGSAPSPCDGTTPRGGTAAGGCSIFPSACIVPYY